MRWRWRFEHLPKYLNLSVILFNSLTRCVHNPWLGSAKLLRKFLPFNLQKYNIRSTYRGINLPKVLNNQPNTNYPTIRIICWVTWMLTKETTISLRLSLQLVPYGLFYDSPYKIIYQEQKGDAVLISILLMGQKKFQGKDTRDKLRRTLQNVSS